MAMRSPREILVSIVTALEAMLPVRSMAAMLVAMVVSASRHYAQSDNLMHQFFIARRHMQTFLVATVQPGDEPLFRKLRHR